MSKLANRMKTRTGQNVMGPVSGGMPVGSTFPHGGGCGVAPQATPQSWGSACPSGFCTSADLATALNRAFAGERQGCRELPYWLEGTSTAGGLLTLTQNALVTICPTRVVILETLNGAIPDLAVMNEFTIGNQNQIAGDPLPVNVLALGAYQTIPFVTDCIKAGIPFTVGFAGLDATTAYYVGLIGPAVG